MRDFAMCIIMMMMINLYLNDSHERWNVVNPSLVAALDPLPARENLLAVKLFPLTFRLIDLSSSLLIVYDGRDDDIVA